MHRFNTCRLLFSAARPRIMLLFAAWLLSAVSWAGQPVAVSEDYASARALDCVFYNGRVVPLSTVATDFTLKLTGAPTFRGLSSERVMLSVLLYPREWNDVAFLRVDEPQLRAILGAEGEYVSPSALIDSTGQYRPGAIYPTADDALQEAVMRLDEKAEVLVRLREQTLYEPLSGADTPRSEFSLRAEILYNHLAPVRWLFIPLLLWGMTLLLLRACGRQESRTLAGVVTGSLFVAVASAWGVRWWLQEHVPLAAGHEVMLFSSGVLLSVALAGVRRRSILVPVGVICAGCAAFVARLGGANPVMTSLVAALDSPWLSAHVSLMMVAYSMLVLTFPLSFFRRCRVLLYRVNVCGEVILTLGIIAGALWAKIAWGRYWAWDPKETCALVTLLLYALPLLKGARGLGFTTGPLYYLAALIAVVITYVGPTFLGPSLHNY